MSHTYPYDRFDHDKLVDAEILGEEALELKVENIDAFKLKQLELEHELKLKELEIKKEDEFKLKELEMKEMEKRKEDELKLKQAELEMKERLEMDKKEKEDVFKLKELEMKERLEMEKMKIEMVKEESNTEVQPKSEYFDAAKNIRLVPDFVKKQPINIFHSLRKLLIICIGQSHIGLQCYKVFLRERPLKYTLHFHQKKVPIMTR
ncbi:Hypothetical predicted protein [Mytilus galloprovincialis]|uniref:Uncharacterized protein n=1 Tax=Mytilus galloprovincialis TaxID=29158 RepID=A0A8B6C7S1_MYTGA|nr:Hypothetical predicted protein [Mytilus galloprovincialis]